MAIESLFDLLSNNTRKPTKEGKGKMRSNTRRFRLTLIWLALLTLVLSLGLGLSASAQGPGDWTEYSSNPIFGESVGGPKAYYPSVLYDADEFSGHGAYAKYKMWYGTSGQQTGLATSDDGINWADHGVVMTDGYHATVEYYPAGFTGANTGGTPSSATMYYRMWYWNTSSLYAVTAIGYTESPDGVNWYNDQPCQNGAVPIVSSGDPWWNRGSYGPCDVLYNPSASDSGTNWTFTMYYDGTTGGTEAIGLGFSSDGITWTGYDANSDGKADPVLEGSYVDGDWDKTYVSRATIIKNAVDDYEMWYSGGVGAMDHGIGYATSSDGINWTRDADNPIFHKDDGVDWRDERTYCPAVLKDESAYKMWFTGKDTVNHDYSIGYATPPPDIVWVDDNWTSQTDADAFDPSLIWQYDAFSSLQDGVNAVAGGGTVNVRDGTYGVTGQTNQHGYSTAILIKDKDDLTIQAALGHQPVVQPATAANIVSISIENCDGLIIDNIDSDQTIAQFDNWHVFDSDNLAVRNCRFEGGEDGIDFNTDLTTALIENNEFVDINTGSGDEVLDFTDGSYSDIVIQDNVFENNYRHITINPPSGDAASMFIIRRNFMDGTTSQEGVRLNDGGGLVSDVILENNVIMNSRQQGLYVKPPVSNITVRHNTFFNNTEEEIRLREAAGDVVIKNNIIYANGTHAAISARLPFPHGPLPGEDFNLIFNTGLSTESGSASPISAFGDNTIIGLDPLFVSTTPGSEDLHLQPGSPAIEAGTDLGVSDDIEKSSRPNPAGTDPDIGAYEVGRPAPRVAKQGVISDLSALLPTGDKKTDHGIEEAIKHIEKSLDDRYWVDDNHLDSKDGNRVFDEEKKAVKELKHLMDKKDTPQGVKDVCQAVIDKLIDADDILAHTAYDEASAYAGDPKVAKELEKAQEELEKAQEELDHTKKDGTSDPRYDKAIDHYKKAWEHACKTKKAKTAAIEPLAVPDEVTVVAYPNPIRDVHTATFQARGTLAAEVEEIRVQIYDLSGHLVWEDAALGSELDWHTDSLSGDYLANGIYLYKVQVRIGGNWINQDIGKIAVLR